MGATCFCFNAMNTIRTRKLPRLALGNYMSLRLSGIFKVVY